MFKIRYSMSPPVMAEQTFDNCDEAEAFINHLRKEDYKFISNKKDIQKYYLVEYLEK